MLSVFKIEYCIVFIIPDANKARFAPEIQQHTTVVSHRVALRMRRPKNDRRVYVRGGNCTLNIEYPYAMLMIHYVCELNSNNSLLLNSLLLMALLSQYLYIRYIHT